MLDLMLKVTAGIQKNLSQFILVTKKGILSARDSLNSMQKEMEDPHFEKGQEFTDFSTFKRAVKNYSIRSKRQIRFKRSDKKRVQVVCQTGCPWNLWCAPTSNGVQITSCCLRHDSCILNFDNKFGDYHYIAKKYLQRFQADPH
ncbi:hypothetical protein LINPERPRIM_LOCUS25647 [Linum perenne]